MNLKFKYVIAPIRGRVCVQKLHSNIFRKNVRSIRVLFPASFPSTHTYHMVPWAGIESAVSSSHGLLVKRHKRRLIGNLSCGIWSIALNIMKTKADH